MDHKTHKYACWNKLSMQQEMLKDSVLQELAKLLADYCTGSFITEVFQKQNIVDVIGPNQTKWRRLYTAFESDQTKYQCSNRTLAVIKIILDPVRFVKSLDAFEIMRQRLNLILSFVGLEYEATGEFHRCSVAQTLAEAELRYSTIQIKLQGRNIHPNVLTYCRPELLQNNYFHAVFEATKGLAQCIRDKSGSVKDGAALIDEVFPKKDPILAFTDLKTETERSEHVGFAALLKGCFAAVRNPLAHTPKIHWEGDDNAADYLTLISLLHRKIDDCRKVGKP